MVSPPTAAAPRRRRRWLIRTAQVALGIIAGLAITEAIFWFRDDGAFPHLKLYRPDPVLGARLEPGTSQRLAFGGNPVTHVRINGDGYRGAALPAPGPDDVLVVGDSQVFGLGVEEGQTFSARLGAALGRTVINGGVPTYGPAEYKAVVAEMLAKRTPKTVIYTINLVNDLFEAARPNAERHVIWDGWAVRRETSPGDVTWFPGRHLLFNRSHAFFALRRWRHQLGPNLDEIRYASEGTWKDIAGAGTEATSKHAQADRWIGERRTISDTESKLRATENQLDVATTKAFHDIIDVDEGENRVKLEAARANPGDIVSDHNRYAEAAGDIVVTAELIRKGAAYRAQLQVELLKKAKASGDQKVLDAFQARADLQKQLARLDASAGLPPLESPLVPVLREVKALCDAHGARLVVLVLPMDVQVSADEWRKYGKVSPIDMAPTKVLIDDIVASAQALGASALDATAALAAAEPGAFLHRDIHMTPKGHQAVADALVPVLAAPPPSPRPAPGVLAAGRSPVPVPAIWAAAPEVVVTGSTKAGCETKMVREWLRVACRTFDYTSPVPVDLQVVSDSRGEAMAFAIHGATTLVVPVLPGDEIVADFRWESHTRRLSIRWPKEAAKPAMAFAEPVATPPAPRGTYDTTPVEKAICLCWQQQYGPLSCNGAYGAPDAACVKTYANDCAQLLACIRRDPASPPGTAPPAAAPADTTRMEPEPQRPAPPDPTRRGPQQPAAGR